MEYVNIQLSKTSYIHLNNKVSFTLKILASFSSSLSGILKPPAKVGASLGGVRGHASQGKFLKIALQIEPFYSIHAIISCIFLAQT